MLDEYSFAIRATDAASGRSIFRRLSRVPTTVALFLFACKLLPGEYWQFNLNYHGDVDPHNLKKTDAARPSLFPRKGRVEYWDGPRYLCIHALVMNSSYQIVVEVVKIEDCIRVVEQDDMGEGLGWSGAVFGWLVSAFSSALSLVGT
jgi:hypothetical protein